MNICQSVCASFPFDFEGGKLDLIYKFLIIACLLTYGLNYEQFSV